MINKNNKKILEFCYVLSGYRKFGSVLKCWEQLFIAGNFELNLDFIKYLWIYSIFLNFN